MHVRKLLWQFAVPAVLASGLVVQPVWFKENRFGAGLNDAIAQGRSGDHANDRSGDRGANGQGAENGTQGAGGSSASAQGIASRSTHGKGLGLPGGVPGQPQGVGAPDGAGTPNAIVRQFLLAHPELELTQGELSRTLRSWNSLNRSLEAYLANMDNPNSLPGLQISYVRDNMNAQAAFQSFEALGGMPALTATIAGLPDLPATLGEPIPSITLADLQVAQEVLATADPASPEYAAAQATVDLYNDPVYQAWQVYDATESMAQDAFMAASVSYSGEYDEATLGEFRGYVDGIIEMKELDTLVADYDAGTP